MALPSELATFQKVPDAPPAKSVRLQCLATNGQTFQSGSLIRISVPHRANSFLIQGQSYLEFDIALDSTLYSSTDYAVSGASGITNIGFAPDGHASSVISQLQELQGSTQISIIQGYNKLYSMFKDAQCPREQTTGTGGAWSISGLSSDPRTVSSATAGFNVNNIISPGMTAKVCFPLISPIFGAGQNSKWINLDRLNNDLVLELQLDSFLNAFKLWVYNGTNWLSGTGITATNPANAISHLSIKNVAFVAQTVELDGQTMAMYNKLHPGPIEYAVHSFRGYSTSLTSPLTSYSALVPARFSSVNSIYHGLFDNALVNSLTGGSVGWRQRANLSTVAYRVGSSVYPTSKPVDCNTITSAEVFMELQKALGNVSNTKESSVAFTQNEYVLDAAGAAGAFMMAQELSVFPHTAPGTVFSGANTLASNLFVDYTFGTSGMSTGTFNAWQWVLFDGRLLIDEQGSMHIVF